MYWLSIIAFIVFFVFARDFLQLPRYGVLERKRIRAPAMGLLIAFGTLPMRHSEH
tara:strand:+ start:2139 stop:2303 length:165 start_codon:yes stop_codon:yes gene_type:complete